LVVTEEGKVSLANAKPSRSLLAGFCLVVVLAFLGAIGTSKLYWGYYIRRPSLDKRMIAIDRVISLTAVRSERRSDGTVQLEIDDAYHVSDHLATCRQEKPSKLYYCLSGRVLVSLDSLGVVLPSPDPMPPEELERLYDRLEATGLLRDGTPGYDHAKELSGIVLEAEGRNGERYLFAGVTGRQVSNDHYPYYEFLFEAGDRHPVPILLSHNRFFYDVAGMEGAEWHLAFPLFLLVGTFVLALALMVFAVVNGSKYKNTWQTTTVAVILVLAFALILAYGCLGWK
jgi:hypothetical protein